MSNTPKLVTLFILFTTLVMPCCAQPIEQTTTLSNGLTLITAQRTSLPLIEIDLWVKAGSREELPQQDGCAHFLEHTLFRGSIHYPDTTADMAMEKLGGILNSATGPDYAHFYTLIPAQNLQPALAILEDIIRHPTFPQTYVDSERKVILDELALRGSSEMETATLNMYVAAFPTMPYSLSPGGSSAQIKVRTRAQLVAFYRRCYRPDRAVLVLTGSLGLSPGRAVRSTFGKWQCPTAAMIPPVDEAPNLMGDTIQKTTSHKAGLVMVAFRTPRASHRNRSVCALLLTALLNHAAASPFDQISLLRDRHALAECNPRHDPSLFILTARLKPEDTIQTATQVANALQRAISDLAPVCESRSELALAALRLLGRQEYNIETLHGLAKEIGYAAVTGGVKPTDLREQLDQITTDQVEALIQSDYTPNRSTTLILLPSQPAIPGNTF